MKNTGSGAFQHPVEAFPRSTLEKRFDDFDRLHSDMKEVDPGLCLGSRLCFCTLWRLIDTVNSLFLPFFRLRPPLPEKKFMASTDASVACHESA